MSLGFLSLIYRRLTGRFLETFIIILCLALAGAVTIAAVSMATIFGWTPVLDEKDIVSREIRVTPVRFSRLAETFPVVRAGSADRPEMTGLAFADIQQLKLACPLVQYCYFEIGLFAEKGAGSGVSGDYFAAHGLTAASGTLFTDADLQAGKHVAVLGPGFAGRFLGDRSPLDGYLTMKDGAKYKIVGVLNQNGTDTSDGNNFYISNPADPDAKVYPAMVCVVSRAREMQSAIAMINRFMNRKYGAGNVYADPVLVDDVKKEDKYPITRTILLLALGCLAISELIVLNIMYARGIRHMKDIGIAIALGTSRITIFLQQLTEILIVSLLGCVFAVCASMVFLKFLGNNMNDILWLPVNPDATTVALSLALVLLASLGAGLYPSYRAMRLNAVDSLRTN